MEDIIHGPQEGRAIIFKTKDHGMICECASWGCEGFVILICMVNLNLIIPRESIH